MGNQPTTTDDPSGRVIVSDTEEQVEKLRWWLENYWDISASLDRPRKLPSGMWVLDPVAEPDPRWVALHTAYQNTLTSRELNNNPDLRQSRRLLQGAALLGSGINVYVPTSAAKIQAALPSMDETRLKILPLDETAPLVGMQATGIGGFSDNFVPKGRLPTKLIHPKRPFYFKLDEIKNTYTLVASVYVTLTGRVNTPENLASAGAFFKKRIESIWNQGTFDLVATTSYKRQYHGTLSGAVLHFDTECTLLVKTKRLKPLVEIQFVTDLAQANVLLILHEGEAPYWTGGKGRPSGVRETGILEVWRDDEDHKNNIMAHEFGHIIGGLPHPGQRLPWWDRPAPNDPRDYSVDPTSLMGPNQTELRDWYFEPWIESLSADQNLTRVRNGLAVSQFTKWEAKPSTP